MPRHEARARFLEALTAENFTVQGDMLIRNNAGTVLARFKSVYMK
jgi:hypothetical protein